jgi:hypothetical protein
MTVHSALAWTWCPCHNKKLCDAFQNSEIDRKATCQLLLSNTAHHLHRKHACPLSHTHTHTHTRQCFSSYQINVCTLIANNCTSPCSEICCTISFYIYRMSQDERSISWEVIVSVILSKKSVYVDVSYSERF